jgi:hypothetical protein
MIQQLKHQRQHCKPLKISEKLDNFCAMALFFMSDAVSNFTSMEGSSNSVHKNYMTAIP